MHSLKKKFFSWFLENSFCKVFNWKTVQYHEWGHEDSFPNIESINTKHLPLRRYTSSSRREVAVLPTPTCPLHSPR